MKQPDDYRQPDAAFRDDETAQAFADQQESHTRRQTVERSFETQSGYLVLIKQLGSRYALSFKRQIGTPPTSSIFLTADEGQRLSNMLGSNSCREDEHSAPVNDLNKNIDSLKSLPNRRRQSAITMPTLLFLISLVLWTVLAMLVFQLQFPSVH